MIVKGKYNKSIFWLIVSITTVNGLDCVYDGEVQPPTSGVICNCDDEEADQTSLVSSKTKFIKGEHCFLYRRVKHQNQKPQVEMCSLTLIFFYEN